MKMEKSKKKKVKKSSLKVVVRKPPSRAAKVKNEQIKKEKSSNKIKTEDPGKIRAPCVQRKFQDHRITK
jgi:hypothetical protein